MNPDLAKLYIGIDVGTQSTKGLLLQANQTGAQAVIKRAAREYPLLPNLPPGAAEQHPHTWRDAVRDVVAELIKDVSPAAIGGIGISGQQHGLVVLDERGEVIRAAKLWCDTTTAKEAAEISERAGINVPSGFTLPKLLWLKRHEPANFARIRHVLLPHDYINFLLTGRAFMEAGDASGSGAFRPQTRDFDRELLSWVDPKVPSFFPELVPAHLPAGTVSAAGAAWIGLPAGVPVSPGGGDNMMSAIGAGATRPGVAVISLGTSGTVFAYSAKPVVDPKGDIAAFCDSTGGWLPLLCTMNVTGVTEEIRKGFGLSHQAATELAEQAPRGAGGLCLLPYFAGERVPNLPDATGSLLGLRPGLFTPGNLYRAALEGVTFGLAAGVTRLRALGITLDEVRLVGGGSRNRLWRQIISDVLGVSVVCPEEPESAALGGALQALWVVQNAAGTRQEPFAATSAYVQLSAEKVTPSAVATAEYAAQLAQFVSRSQELYGHD